MNIGVHQCDGSYPNLAIMKIAGFHEKRGDTIDWYNGLLYADTYDKIYMSKIFSFTPMPEVPSNAVIGGTGIDFFNRMPQEIEDAEPSYSLYPDCNYHIGFSMKGCRFNCKFCCVPKKEGRPYDYNSIDEILTNPKGKDRLMLLDNDFFGGENWKRNLERIIELNLRVCFLQGLNIRIITDEQAQLLSKCKYRNSRFKDKYLTFAWDRYNDGKIVMAGIDRCVKAGIPTTAMQFFVLIGFDTTPEQDLERIETLRKLGCLPFVMPYDKNNDYQKRFARWVNSRWIFKTVEWKDYIHNYVR
jgi:hypothetical protein